MKKMLNNKSEMLNAPIFDRKVKKPFLAPRE